MILFDPFCRPADCPESTVLFAHTELEVNAPTPTRVQIKPDDDRRGER